MRLEPLYDLQQEINRLFIAGSKFANGDLRLQKQIPVFRKLGEKAPVFAKLANEIEALIQTDPQQSADKLTAISTLLYSILYTQGETTDTESEIKEQKPFMNLEDVNTEFSYLQLRSVIQALSTSNSGRLEILKEAKERGLFKDSRMFQYLDFALADKYGELAEYVAKEIIPEIGKPMIPFLKRNFQYVDKTEQVRRLHLLDQLQDSDVPQMVEKILAESLPMLQAEAIIILAKDPNNEELIRKLTEDKNKIVREAAYEALAKIGSKSALEKLKDIYLKVKSKAQLSAVVSALASSKIPFFFEEIFEEVTVAFEEFIALDKNTEDKILTAKMERFSTLLEVLRKKEDPKVDALFIRILTDNRFVNLAKAKKTLLDNFIRETMYSFTRTLANRPPEKAIAFYDQHLSRALDAPWLSHPWMIYLLETAKQKWSKERIYECFHISFVKGYLSVGSLYNAFSDGASYSYYYSNHDTVVYIDLIDPRWLNGFYTLFPAKKNWNSDNMNALVMLAACDQSKKCDKLLEETLKYTQSAVQNGIIRLIIKRDMKDKFDTIYSAAEKYPKGDIYMLGYLQNCDIWTQFPDKYAVKFRKLAEKTKQDVYNRIADEIENK